LCGAGNWTFRKINKKYLESFETWRCRRLQSWAIRVKNEKLLRKGEVERNVLHTMKRRKDYWIGLIVLRTCLLKHVIDGTREVTGRGGTRRKQLLDDFKENCWKLKDDALAHTQWRTRFRRGCGLVTGRTTQRMTFFSS
jgi:hypothetical protein